MYAWKEAGTLAAPNKLQIIKSNSVAESRVR